LRTWRWIVATVVLTLLAAAVVAWFVFLPRLRREARERTQNYLADRFDSDVQIADFHVGLFPRIHISVEGIVLRAHGRTDVPPLIEIKRASFDANLSGLLGRAVTIHEVDLDGLQIHTPPRYPDSPPALHGTNEDLAKKYPIMIEEIRAEQASLTLVRKPEDGDKPPNQFDIHQLVMKDFAFDRPASFQALLTNPRPRGLIHTQGEFGPWLAEDPARTPVHGTYNFDHADMSTLKGLSGTLSSTGSFTGPLDILAVEGHTDIPDFALRVSDHPMELQTDYSAIVDGTNGNTLLKSVTAKFGHTTLYTQGEVVDLNKGVKGRTIELHAQANNARIEDLLLLAVKSNPPAMTGSARLETRIDIPENDEDLIDKMKLDGQFGIANIHFTDQNTQGKVDSLSRHGQGQPQNEDIEGELSQLRGRFTMGKATISMSNLSFAVSGAHVDLGGTYAMDSGQLDFIGKLRLDAKLSQTTTGMKSFFLKAVDPFFSKNNAGTELPIKITGTKDHPSFGLDFHDPKNKK
jgi:uncharacterized protein involved in outer membrane biogenesis